MSRKPEPNWSPPTLHVDPLVLFDLELSPDAVLTHLAVSFLTEVRGGGRRDDLEALLGFEPKRLGRALRELRNKDLIQMKDGFPGLLAPWPLVDSARQKLGHLLARQLAPGVVAGEPGSETLKFKAGRAVHVRNAAEQRRKPARASNRPKRYVEADERATHSEEIKAWRARQARARAEREAAALKAEQEAERRAKPFPPRKVTRRPLNP